MKCLVTGGAGFIGGHVAELLVKEGHEVVIIDNFLSGNEENYTDFKDKVTVHKKDIRDDLSEVFKDGFDVVFHLAAIPSVQYSIANPIETDDVNIRGTVNLLEHARKANVKRFILASSCSVYGENPTLPFTEDLRPEPISPYALQKNAGENYLATYHACHGMETISLRFFNVYGPRQNPKGEYACMIAKFCAMINEGKTPNIYGDGKNTRDYIFVTDVAKANLLAATTQDPAAFGQVFNVGEGIQRSVNEVVGKIIETSGKDITPTHGDPVVEPPHAMADITKSKQVLGWQPSVTFEEGLKQTYAFFSK